MDDASKTLKFDTTGNLYNDSPKPLGGKLKISDTEIYFEWYKPNVPGGPITIPLNTIKEVKKSNTYAVIPNAMTITTKEGKEYKFILSDRDAIASYLQERVEK
ncbi:MAG: GRAM domain-containing protein [Cellulosilyticaceae bacterium]